MGRLILNPQEKALNYLNCKKKYSSVKNFFSSLNDSVNYTIIKGEPLSFYCFNQLGSRYSSDIDILVAPDDILSVKKILIENEFLPSSVFYQQAQQRLKRVFYSTSTHQLEPYIFSKSPMNIEVDVNFDLFWAEHSGEKIDIKEFISDARVMSLYGVECKVLTPIKTFLQLCLHHYKDMNSLFLLSTSNTINSEKYYEIYTLLVNNTKDFSPKKVKIESIKYNILPYIYYILFYTNQVFPSSLLIEYLKELYCEEGENLLDKYGLNSEEQKIWKCSFYERLDNSDIFSLIEKSLTEKDIKKININRKLFGYEQLNLD